MKYADFCRTNSRLPGLNPQRFARTGGPQGGPGTELKKLLHAMRIDPTGNCACADKAARMDREGPDWCEANIETIIGWLADEAQRRHLPFVRFGAKLLVKRAISRARNRQCKASAQPVNESGKKG